MTQAPNPGNSSSETGKTAASNPQAPQVDIQELTDRVYRLFLKDLETQRQRLHGTRPRR